MPNPHCDLARATRRTLLLRYTHACARVIAQDLESRIEDLPGADEADGKSATSLVSACAGGRSTPASVFSTPLRARRPVRRGAGQASRLAAGNRRRRPLLRCTGTPRRAGFGVRRLRARARAPGVEVAASAVIRRFGPGRLGGQGGGCGRRDRARPAKPAPAVLERRAGHRRRAVGLPTLRWRVVARACRQMHRDTTNAREDQSHVVR